MNERINELIEQATTEEQDGFRYFDKKKFAELIVRECAKIAAYQGACMTDYKILKHFGVEE
jgi:tellurite resistance protein